LIEFGELISKNLDETVKGLEITQYSLFGTSLNSTNLTRPLSFKLNTWVYRTRVIPVVIPEAPNKMIKRLKFLKISCVFAFVKIAIPAKNAKLVKAQ
jgi:hypothetical protein